MDYDMLSFRVVSLRRGWAEVIVHNREIRWPPKTMWLRRERVEFRPWAAYLLEIHSIETPEAAPVYAGPDASGETTSRLRRGAHFRCWKSVDRWARVAYADATWRPRRGRSGGSAGMDLRRPGARGCSCGTPF